MDSNCTSPLSSNGACSLAASNKSSIDESIDSKQDEIVIDEAINKQPKPPAVKLKKNSKLKGSIEIKSRRSSLTTEDGSSKNPNFRARSGSWPSSDKEMKRRNVDYDTKLTIEINKELGIESGKQMKNPWGNLSYSQLIEKAIESSTWKSLTLKEIYAWFTKHVPYFKDKINYKSTMGWKNSIRHNLSLHKKFIRVGIYQWNNRYNRPSAKPIKYVWTSLTYKPKSLKSKAVMCEHNKLNHDSCCANRANQNICHNLNTFNANLQHLDANQLLCMYRILSNNDTLKEYLQNNINNGPPRDKTQTQNNQSFNEPENKYFGLNEMLNRQNPTTNTLVENYYKLLNTLTNQNTNIDFRNRLNMPVTPVQLFPVNNSNIPRFQMQNYPFIQLPIQTVPQGPKFFSYPNYSNLFLQKPTIYPNVTPQATMKARAQVDNTIPTPSQILLTSEMRNTNNESSVQANKHSSLLSTNCILEDDIQPPFKVSKTNSLNMFEKQLCDDDDLTKLEHSSLNEDNESDCKRDDCSNNSNSSDNSWNSSSSDDISSYNYKRKLMDRYITEDEYSHHKRMKTSHDMDNNNYNNHNNNNNNNNNNSNHNSNNNNNNNNNNNQLNSNNIHSHLSELLDSNNNNIRIHKAILKNH